MTAYVITDKEGKEHDLELSEIDELDEISGDDQLCRIFCYTHKKHESHWIPWRLFRSEE